MSDVTICGSLGDPILYPNIVDLIKLINTFSPECDILIHTNGTMHDENWWKEFAGLNVTVQFAVDGVTDTSYKKYRKGGNRDKLFRNIRAYALAGGKSHFQCILFKHNEKELENFKILAKKYGAYQKVQMSFQYDKDFERPKLYERAKGTDCFSLEKEQISIDHDGTVTPCCHTRPFKLDQENLKLFEKEKHLLDLRTSTIEKAIETRFFKRFWNRNTTNICKNSCYAAKRYGIKIRKC